MDRTINAKELRASLPKIVEGVRRGERFTVIYRSRPALRIVPISDEAQGELPLADDPLYRAGPVGASTDGLSSKDHDSILYGR
jgi:antitoxin (DNA-binding transcriptional repressor) of toxin-antitoxin stability system